MKRWEVVLLIALGIIILYAIIVFVLAVRDGALQTNVTRIMQIIPANTSNPYDVNLSKLINWTNGS